MNRVVQSGSAFEPECRSSSRRRGWLALAAVLALLATACVPDQPPGSPGTTNPPGTLAPVAVATAMASAGPAPFTAQLLSTGSVDPDGTIVSYSWDLGDGTTSNQADPTTIYQAPGTYTVKLTVTDNDGHSTTAAPFTVEAYTPGDPSSLIYFPALSRSVGVFTDQIAVWTCKVTGSDGPDHDPAEIAAWAQAEADAYFDVVARGRYKAVFTPMGTFEISPQNYTQGDCLSAVEAHTDAPFTNAMAVDTTKIGGGLGGPGYVRSDGTAYAPDQPPSASLRGFVIGGGSYSELPDPHALVHEIGHTLHFPHSFLDPSYEYDNPMDVMSARAPVKMCSVPGWTYSCRPQNNIAFNRWAAGWIDADQVTVHTDGSETVTLAGPESTTGTQLIVAPSSTSSRALVTIEARPRQGLDQYLNKGGIVVHVVDQRTQMCYVGSFDACPSLWRRQGQAMGQKNTYDHVLAPGQTKTVHGLTISAGQVIGSGQEVTVSGRPTVSTGALLTSAVPPTAQLRRGNSGNGDGAVLIDLP